MDSRKNFHLYNVANCCSQISLTVNTSYVQCTLKESQSLVYELHQCAHLSIFLSYFTDKKIFFGEES